jgi:endonuclease III
LHGLREARLDGLLQRLQRFYGLLAKPPRAPFTLFVWGVLSNHAVPAKRDAALNALKRIPALTPDSMWRAPRAKLEAAVQLAGPYLDQRLGALRLGVDLFRRTPELTAVIRGPLAAARQVLKPFPQLGESDSRRFLLFAADHAVLPMDPRIHRVGSRLGYGRRSDDVRKAGRSVHRALTRELACEVDAFRRAFVYLSHHGAATCTEADPHCAVCPLLFDCPEGKRRVSS